MEKNEVNTEESTTNTTISEKKTSENETDKEPTFVEKWKNHRFLIVRGSYVVLNSIWMVVMAVGMFLAWLIALLAT